MTLRPYGLILDGTLELGLELELEGARIVAIRPHTGVPDPFVLSPAFVNAHSHLEYRGLQGRIPSGDYWPWIRELTLAKAGQPEDQVKRDCEIAARENRGTGVARIAEHSDRPFAGAALRGSGIEGEVYQEVITFFERETREQKLEKIRARAADQAAAFDGPVRISPHAYHTVDEATLREIAEADLPFSIHVAETTAESDFTRTGEGPIAEFYRSNGIAFTPDGRTVFERLKDLGLVRRGAQFVHACDLHEVELEQIQRAGVGIAHCPRSNQSLGCPRAPVREMLDLGIAVGLGLDSAASSGPIDMFAEMRAALETGIERGRPVLGDEVWRMATDAGARSFGAQQLQWNIAIGSTVPLIKLHVPNAATVTELIEQAVPGLVEWVPGPDY